MSGQKAIISLFRKNRMLLPGSVLILILLLGLLLRFGYNRHILLRNEIETSKRLYLGASSLIASGEGIQKRVNSAKLRLGQIERGLLHAKQTPVAAATLQNKIKFMAEKRGITISSSRPLSRTKKGAYTSIPIEFNFKVKIEQLKALLYDIQTSPFIMDVTFIRIRRRGKGDSEGLETTLRIEGLMTTI